MSSKDQGQLSSLYLPDNPADAIVSAPSIIASLGNLKNRFEMGFNHPAAIPGCVALYDFTDESTAILYDKSELGNDLTATSIVAGNYIDTPFGKGVDLDGSADYFEDTGFPTTLGDQLTVEIIMKVNAVSTWAMAVNKGILADRNYSLQLHNTGKYLRFNINVSNTEYSAGDDDQVDVTGLDYIHAAGTYNGSLIKLFRQGLQIGETAQTGNVDDTSAILSIGRENGSAYPLDANIVIVRICYRALDPSEFMHHWYLKTLSDGNFGGSSVLFDPQISAFPKRKSHLITVNWNREEKTEWANLLVNTKKGSPTDITLPAEDLTELYLGGLPEIDDDVVAYHVFDGTLALDNDGSTTGRVKDWSGNNHHATLVGSPSLVNKKWGQAYDLAGATIYATVPDSDQLSFGNFSIETAFRLDTLSANTTIISKEDGTSTREWRLEVQTDGDVSVLVFETDTTDYLQFTAAAGIVLGTYNTVGFAHIDNSDNTSTTVIVVNGIAYTPSAVETGTYTGMLNLGSVVTFGNNNSGSAPIDGQIFYSRISNVARSTDEMIHNSLNFYKRANGDVQDTWLT